MITQLTATIIGGVLKPDQPLSLPEQTRVNVMIEPIAKENEAVKGWETFRAWILQNSVHGLGRRLTREELHERR